MIASHKVKVGRETHVLRLSSRAIARIEDETDQAFFDLIGVAENAADQDQDGAAETTEAKPRPRMRMKTIVTILGAAMNDGKGADEDTAFELFDALGFVEANVVLSAIIEKAFGDEKEKAKGEASEPKGNAKAAA